MEKTEIIKLLKSGYNPNLISLEFDLPLKKVQKYINEVYKDLEKEKEIIQKDQEIIYNDEIKKENEFSKYSDFIDSYDKNINYNNTSELNKLNLLAFAYFKINDFENSRNVLTNLIEVQGSFTAYRQLIHLEETVENLDDAKLWAYGAIEMFPNEICFRKEMIKICRLDNDIDEINIQEKYLKSINTYKPYNLEK